MGTINLILTGCMLAVAFWAHHQAKKNPSGAFGYGMIRTALIIVIILVLIVINGGSLISISV